MWQRRSNFFLRCKKDQNRMNENFMIYEELERKFRIYEGSAEWRYAQYTAELIMEAIDRGVTVPVKVWAPPGGVDANGFPVISKFGAADGENQIHALPALLQPTIYESRTEVALHWWWQRLRCLACAAPKCAGVAAELELALGSEILLWRLQMAKESKLELQLGFDASDDEVHEEGFERCDYSTEEKAELFSAVETGLFSLGDLTQRQAQPWVSRVAWLRLHTLVELERFGDAIDFIPVLLWFLKGALENDSPSERDRDLFLRIRALVYATRVRLYLSAGLPKNDIVEDVRNALQEGSGVVAADLLFMLWGSGFLSSDEEQLTNCGAPEEVREAFGQLRRNSVEVGCNLSRNCLGLISAAALDRGAVTDAGFSAGQLMKLKPPQWLEIEVWLECLSLVGCKDILQEAAVNLMQDWPESPQAAFATALSELFTNPAAAGSHLQLCMARQRRQLAQTEGTGLRLVSVCMALLAAIHWDAGDVDAAYDVAADFSVQFPESAWNQIFSARRLLYEVLLGNRSKILIEAASVAEALEAHGDVAALQGQWNSAVVHYRGALRAIETGCLRDRFRLAMRRSFPCGALEVQKSVIAAKLVLSGSYLGAERAIKFGQELLKASSFKLPEDGEEQQRIWFQVPGRVSHSQSAVALITELILVMQNHF